MKIDAFKIETLLAENGLTKKDLSVKCGVSAQNISTITPISAVLSIKEVSLMSPKKAGPKNSPAKSAPTTCGILNFEEIKPKSFVLIRINARSNKNL